MPKPEDDIPLGAPPRARRDDAPADRSRAFNAGFAMACAILAKDHGEDSLAYQLLDGAGLGLDQLVAMRLDVDDLATLLQVIHQNAPRRARESAWPAMRSPSPPPPPTPPPQWEGKR